MSNQDQADYWNGDAGLRWVEFSALLDDMLLPFAKDIIRQAKITNTDTVLDVGCGAGALSLMAAKLADHFTGADISAPLIELATERAGSFGNVTFIKADAAELTLDEKVDLVISRFGVMFFSDPVAAFSNIRRQTKKGGRMVFACWQSPMKNMWARAPLEAAMPFLHSPPEPPEPNAPGPFAFASSEFLSDVLMDAGWNSVELSDWTGTIRLPGRGAEDVASFMMEMGPLSRILKEQELDFGAIRKALISTLEKQANNDGTVDLEGAAWIVKAET